MKESDTIEIQRAQMRLKVTIPTREAKKVKAKVKKLATSVEEECFGDDLEMVSMSIKNIFYF